MNQSPRVSEILIQEFFPNLFNQLLSNYWPFLLLFIAVILFKLLFAFYKKQRLAKSEINDIDKMPGKEFEKYLETLFDRLGYQVQRTKYIGDYGADLVTSKNGIKTIIQAKRYKNKKVGIKAIQEAVAAKGYYGCEKAMVVTNSFYTEQANNQQKVAGKIICSEALKIY